MGAWQDVNKTDTCPSCGQTIFICKEWVPDPGHTGLYYPHYLNQSEENMTDWMKRELAEVQAKRYLIIDKSHSCG